MLNRKPLVGRRIVCSGYTRWTVQGATRVMRNVMFHFCKACWSNRRACEQQMIAVTK